LIDEGIDAGHVIYGITESKSSLAPSARTGVRSTRRLWDLTLNFNDWSR